MQCSFCGNKITKDIDAINSDISSDTFICDSCIRKANSIMDAIQKSKLINRNSNHFLPTPQQIVKQLNEYVIGQDYAKKVLAVAAYNHFKQISNPDLDLQKSNVLMTGPTGCGKTYIISKLAKILDVPFAIGDATSLTEAGLSMLN